MPARLSLFCSTDDISPFRRLSLLIVGLSLLKSRDAKPSVYFSRNRFVRRYWRIGRRLRSIGLPKGKANKSQSREIDRNGAGDLLRTHRRIFQCELITQYELPTLQFDSPTPPVAVHFSRHNSAHRPCFGLKCTWSVRAITHDIPPHRTF